jgi:copper(I)-binding protein
MKKELKPSELHMMMNMLKTAINQDREFTADESNKFNDLFETIIENKIIGKL